MTWTTNLRILHLSPAPLAQNNHFTVSDGSHVYAVIPPDAGSIGDIQAYQVALDGIGRISGVSIKRVKGAGSQIFLHHFPLVRRGSRFEKGRLAARHIAKTSMMVQPIGGPYIHDEWSGRLIMYISRSNKLPGAVLDFSGPF